MCVAVNHWPGMVRDGHAGLPCTKPTCQNTEQRWRRQWSTATRHWWACAHSVGTFCSLTYMHFPSFSFRNFSTTSLSGYCYAIPCHTFWCAHSSHLPVTYCWPCSKFFVALVQVAGRHWHHGTLCCAARPFRRWGCSGIKERSCDDLLGWISCYVRR